MKLVHRNTRLFIIILAMALLIVMLGTLTACEDMGFPASSSDEATPEPTPVETGPTVINTKDAAIMAVYRRLLSKAESYEAKMYLADFYAYCDNWTAQSEYYKDGSGTWYIVVDMSANEDWNLRAYWQQASWFVFRDGEVIPSNLFRANALRIEADLQALSPEPEVESE